MVPSNLPIEVPADPKPPLRVIGYVGPRTRGQYNLPFRNHAEAIRSLARTTARKEGREAVVLEIFGDEPLVGGQTWTGTDRMLDRIKASGVDALAVSELAHLVRSGTKFLALCRFLSEHGVRLLALVEHLDTAHLDEAALAEYAHTAFQKGVIRRAPTPAIKPDAK